MSFIIDNILYKKFLITDKYNTNGSDWFMSFEPVDDNIRVTEETTGKKRSHICSYKIINERLHIFLNGSTSYDWLIQNNELWVAGKGGAMNFAMTFSEEIND